MQLVEALSGAFVAIARPGLCTESVVLRPLVDGPVPVKELWRHARVSKRAMTTLLKPAARHGLIAIDDGLVKLVGPPPTVHPSTCEPLVRLVSGFELDHPDFPVTYGPSDQSFTGGPGVDWKPVPRQGPADGLSTSALLSQALVAFGIEYERTAGSIMWAASLVRGDHAEVSSGMERHGVIAEGRPTALGVRIRDAYAPLCAQIESSWRARFGSALTDDVIAAVGGAGPTTFPWVGRPNGHEFIVLASGS